MMIVLCRLPRAPKFANRIAASLSCLISLSLSLFLLFFFQDLRKSQTIFFSSSSVSLFSFSLPDGARPYLSESISKKIKQIVLFHIYIYMKSMRIVYIFIQLAVNRNVPMTSRHVTWRRGRTVMDLSSRMRHITTRAPGIVQCFRPRDLSSCSTASTSARRQSASLPEEPAPSRRIRRERGISWRLICIFFGWNAVATLEKRQIWPEFVFSIVFFVEMLARLE